VQHAVEPLEFRVHRRIDGRRRGVGLEGTHYRNTFTHIRQLELAEGKGGEDARTAKAAEHWVRDTLDRLAERAPELATQALPRAIGKHAFELGGSSGVRAVYPFNVWRWQRAHDYHRALSHESQARIASLLSGIDGRALALLERPIAPGLARRDNQLFLADER